MIWQAGGRVVVVLFVVSVFCVRLFHTDDLPNPELHHLYVNEPHPTAPDTMNAHRGTATLRLKGAVLEGDYYNGPRPARDRRPQVNQDLATG